VKSDKEIIAEYVAKLDAIGDGDKEAAHIQADKLLIAALEDYGLAHLSSAWQRVQIRCKGFWYS